MRRIIMAIYHWKGWKLDGHLPDIPKYVIAGAPHSSNWDFVFFIGATAEEGVEPNFMGKHTLFQGILKNFMLDMGGIPIDRNKRTNMVEQIAAEFDRRERLALVIAAEGTRRSKGEWKSGFYNIARAANVPIVPVWVCNERRLLGFGPAIDPTGSYAQTLLEIARCQAALGEARLGLVALAGLLEVAKGDKKELAEMLRADPELEALRASPKFEGLLKMFAGSPVMGTSAFTQVDTTEMSPLEKALRGEWMWNLLTQKREDRPGAAREGTSASSGAWWNFIEDGAEVDAAEEREREREQE